MTPIVTDAVDFFVRPAAPATAPAPLGAAMYAAEGCATQDIAVAIETLQAGPLLFAGRVPQCRELLDQLTERGAAPPAPDRRLRPRGRAAPPTPRSADLPRRDRAHLPR